MNHTGLFLVVTCALLAGTAGAVTKGGTLYVKSRVAKLLDKPDTSGKVVTQLKSGDEVTWQGAAPENKVFHKVKAGKNEGYTIQQNLSPNKPAPEFLVKDDGKPIDAQAFASSGAATKALSEAALKFSAERGKEKPNMLELTKGVMTAEGISKAVTKDDGAKFVQVQSAGGTP